MALTYKQADARLLKLAGILEALPNDGQDIQPDGEPAFYMGSYQHACGTPACAAGNWAAHNSKRWLFHSNAPLLRTPEVVAALKLLEENPFPRVRSREVIAAEELLYTNRINTDEALKAEFRLNDEEQYLLFSSQGCDRAQSASAAAAYIRNFVAERQMRRTELKTAGVR